MAQPNIRSVTNLFLRIGNTTFGGGYVTMAALGREMVDLRHWITAENYALAFALARVTPGTNVIAFCAAVGWLVLGWTGALIGVLALTVPTAIFAVLLLQGFESGSSYPLIMAALTGTVAAVSGMMWAIVWTLVRPYISRSVSMTARTVLITAGAFLASWKFNLTPIPILSAATLIGLLWRDPPAQ